MSRLPGLKPKDLPDKPAGFWKLAGPGAILVGLSIGAGEIVIWPRIVAEYGASMVWVAGLGVFIQLWINFEIGRWTLATGESVYTGFTRVWGGFALIFILLNILGWLAPGWGRASGLALKALLVGPDGFGSDTMWTVITFLAVAALLFGPRLAYKSVERTIGLLVVLITIGLIAVAVQVGTADHWAAMGKGMLNAPYKDPNMSIKAFFIALVFAGAGGTANLFYTFYLRDKGIGMGKHIPAMKNPLRGTVERAADTGYTFPDEEENRKRFRAWFSHLKKDQLLFFWGMNTVTIVLFMFAALAVLHPKGLVPEAGSLIWDEASVLEEIWGKTGRTLFLLVGVATLFSTQLAVLDGVSRSIADIIHVNWSAAQSKSVGWWYTLIAALWMIFGCIITYIMEARGVSELGFLFNAAYMGGFAMAIYTPLLLIINKRFLPPSARPGPIHTAAMILASCVYGGFAIACLLWEVGILPEST
jgi:hypothetical protein